MSDKLPDLNLMHAEICQRIDQARREQSDGLQVAQSPVVVDQSGKLKTSAGAVAPSFVSPDPLAEGAAAERERIRLELKAVADAWEGEPHAQALMEAQGLRKFARRLEPAPVGPEDNR